MRAADFAIGGGIAAHGPQARRRPSLGDAALRLIVLLVAGCAVTVAVAGAVSLWSHYAAIVFFETIRVGFAVCFG